MIYLNRVYKPIVFSYSNINTSVPNLADVVARATIQTESRKALYIQEQNRSSFYGVSTARYNPFAKLSGSNVKVGGVKIT